MLIDDDPSESRMYVNLLKLEGFSVTHAGNGQDGLAKAAAEKPELILLDVMMPQMNGFMTLQLIKASEKLRNVPVVMLTNLSGKDNEDEACRLGAAKYLVKSNVDNKQLIVIIRDILASALKIS